MHFFRRYLTTIKPNVLSNFVLHFLFRVRGGESDFIPLRNTAKNSLSNTNKNLGYLNNKENSTQRVSK